MKLFLCSEEIFLDEEDGSVNLTDDFEFASGIHTIQEAFVTYKSVKIINKQQLILQGEKYSLEVSIDNGNFGVESLDRDSHENEKEQILKRISVEIDNCTRGRFVLKCRIF